MKPTFALPLAALAALTAARARADFAIQNDPSDDTFLMYADGGEIVLAQCNEDTDVFNRASCATSPLRVDLARFDYGLKQQFGEQLDELSRQQRDAWVNLGNVDARIFELVSSWPAHDPAPSDDELKAADRELATTDAGIADARDQIVRMEAALAAGNDPEVLTQLTITRQKLEALLKKAETQRASINDLRQRYIAARSQDANPDYKDLVAMRQSFAARIKSTNTDILKALDEKALGETMVRRVRDSFVWTSTAHQPVYGARDLFWAYLDAETEMRTWRAQSAAGARDLSMTTTQSGWLDEIWCSFPMVSDSGQCDLALTAPGGHAASYEGDFVRNSKIEFSSITFDYLHDRMNANYFFNQPLPAGLYTVKINCTTPVPATPAFPSQCYVRLKRPWQ
jgi:hypothetical protein